MVKNIIRLESLIIFILSLYLYQQMSGNWLQFLLLILLLDISMVGYLKDKKLGAIIYNLGHNYILGVVLILAGIFLQNNFYLSLGLIVSAHVSADRFFGFGLKYSTNFKDTHIQKL